MKNNFALVLIVGLALGLSACKDKSTTETTEKSEVNGTTVETTKSTETTVDDQGNSQSQTDTKTTVDPEGLMNKKTIDETHTEESH